MRTAIAVIKGKTPYSQSKAIFADKLSKEGKDEVEKRTWRKRMHVDANGQVYIPPMAFKNCLSDCARFMAQTIPGKGKATYTKHFEAGVMVTEPLALGVNASDVEGEWLHVPSDGKRGGSKRVLRCFPRIDQWGGEVKFYISDETISNEAFEFHLRQAGEFIGVGRFRPRNNGYYGRFEVVSIKWLDDK